LIVKKIENIDYIIFDPSKNITALVISKVDVSTYKDISKKIMDKEPLVEQVGFLTFDGESDISLRMAGGEFCGNATMCAAVYHVMKNELPSANVKVKVFGTDGLIDVEIKKIGDSEWEGIVKMPKPLEIKDVTFPNGKTLPVVSFEGISHVIIIDDVSNQSNFTKEEAESVIKEWCDFLNVPAFGMMHYDLKNSNLVPLVYVKSIDTLFWENSCSSGTTAIGTWLFKKELDKKRKSVEIKQPSKSILTISNDENGNIYLKGKVKEDNS
jgi:diaminopimelate epimerase